MDVNEQSIDFTPTGAGPVILPYMDTNEFWSRYGIVSVLVFIENIRQPGVSIIKWVFFWGGGRK